MTISRRLLLPQTGGRHFNAIGLTQSMKWRSFSSSSSSSSGGSEKSSLFKAFKSAKEVTTTDKGSNKGSGTWFKGVLTNLKERVLGSSQGQKPVVGEKSDSKVDTTASEFIVSPHDTKFLESQNVLQPPEVTMSPTAGTEGVATCSTSQTVGENACETAAVTPTSEVSKMHNDSDNAGLGDIPSIAQPSEAVTLSLRNEKDKLRKVASDAMVGNSSLEMDQSRKLSDMFTGKSKNEVKQFEEAVADVMVERVKEQNPSVEDFVGLTVELITEKPKQLPDGIGDLSSFENSKHILGERTETFGQSLNVSTKAGKKRMVSSSLGTKDLASFLESAKKNPTTREAACKLNDTLAPPQFVSGKKAEETSGIKDILECIKGLPGEKSSIIKAQGRTVSNVKDDFSSGGLQKQTNLHNSEVKRSKTSLKHKVSSEKKASLDKKEGSTIPTEAVSERKEGSNLNLSNSGNVKTRPNHPVPPPIGREELNSSSDAYFIEEGSKENKVLLRFVHKNVKHGVLAAFSDCGPTYVEEIPSTNGSIFKDFLLHFETRKGYETARKKKEQFMLNAEAFLETTSEDMDDTISIPDLIADPDAPVALVKNPTRTVKVKELSEDISSQQLKEALAFCQSGISSFFLGSTSSAVYVEFETEDAKERALAEHYILVSGKKLPILRIDAPRTTVVRISNLNPKSDVLEICNYYGEVKYTKQRVWSIMDVHFKLAEWPNMLNIVNSLNGMKVDKNQWVAQPAPVFPPQILRALWSRPEERRRVNALICNLARELGKPISPNSLQFADLANKYYGKDF